MIKVSEDASLGDPVIKIIQKMPVHGERLTALLFSPLTVLSPSTYAAIKAQYIIQQYKSATQQQML